MNLLLIAEVSEDANKQFINIEDMCYSILMLCPSCNSNIRHLKSCAAGTKTSSDFKYTNLTAEVCAASNNLLSVKFQQGTCSDCIRYAKADAKAAEEARLQVAQWEQDLDILARRTDQQERTSALRASPATSSKKRDADDKGGRKALLRLWYDDAKNKSLKTLIPVLALNGGAGVNVDQDQDT